MPMYKEIGLRATKYFKHKTLRGRSTDLRCPHLSVGFLLHLRHVRQHAELSWWEECTHDDWGPTRNDARAYLLNSRPNRYWPREALVKAWLREEWDTWQDEATRPAWFCAAWRDLFPPDWLPPPKIPRLDMSKISP